MSDHNISECKNVFVSWKWLVGIIVGIIMASILATMAYTNHENAQDGLDAHLTEQTNSIDLRLNAVERKMDDYVVRNMSDLDTVKKLLRKKK
jgi:hypothetical protein